MVRATWLGNRQVCTLGNGTARRVQVRRLAQLSLLAVMRDIVPGYRIRLPTEKELAAPVSKDVQRVRDYESTLLRLYQVRCTPGLCQSAANLVLASQTL